MNKKAQVPIDVVKRILGYTPPTDTHKSEPVEGAEGKPDELANRSDFKRCNTVLSTGEVKNG